jgi:GTPase SAR1 family protein
MIWALIQWCTLLGLGFIMIIITMVYRSNERRQVLSRVWWDIIHRYRIWRHGMRVLVTGLDNSGKTTFIDLLRHIVQVPTNNPLTIHPPTKISSVSNNVYIDDRRQGGRGMQFSFIEIGGFSCVRRALEQWMYAMDAVIFMVDAADRSRLQEAAQELKLVLSLACLYHIPVLILGNKMDRKEASITLRELATSLNVPPHPNVRDLEPLQEMLKYTINDVLVHTYSSGSGDNSHWLPDLSSIVSSYLSDTLPGYDDDIELAANGLPTPYQYLMMTKGTPPVADWSPPQPSNGNKNGILRVATCSLAKRSGYIDSLQWLYQHTMLSLPSLLSVSSLVTRQHHKTT